MSSRETSYPQNVKNAPRTQSDAPSFDSGATQNATRLQPADGDLAEVVEAWPNLPAALRAGILAMVRGAVK
jgi:hypothetical protein